MKEAKQEAEEAGEEGPDLAPLGPPLLRLWAAFVMKAPKHVESEDVTIALSHLRQSKDTVELAPGVHIFRFKVLKLGKRGAKLQFAMKTPKAQASVTEIMMK